MIDAAIGVMLGIPVTVLLLVWWSITRLTDVVRAGLDVHMRVQVAIHKELCAMNDRFTPSAGDRPPLAAPGAALEALRGGRAP